MNMFEKCDELHLNCTLLHINHTPTDLSNSFKLRSFNYVHFDSEYTVYSKGCQICGLSLGYRITCSRITKEKNSPFPKWSH